MSDAPDPNEKPTTSSEQPDVLGATSPQDKPDFKCNEKFGVYDGMDPQQILKALSPYFPDVSQEALRIMLFGSFREYYHAGDSDHSSLNAYSALADFPKISARIKELGLDVGAINSSHSEAASADQFQSPQKS